MTVRLEWGHPRQSPLWVSFSRFLRKGSEVPFRPFRSLLLGAFSYSLSSSKVPRFRGSSLPRGGLFAVVFVSN